MRNTTLFILCLTTLMLAVAGPAAAHKTVTTDDGQTKVTWGFLNEPATTWTKTGLDLILRDNATNTGIPGALEDLEGELRYGDEVLPLQLKAQHGKEAEGRYTSQMITLTQPGLYRLYLKGTINGSAIDMEIESKHAIEDISESYFPAPQADPYAAGGSGTDVAALESEIQSLKDRLAALEAQADAQARTPGDTTPATGEGNDTPAPGLVPVLGVLLVGAVLMARRRRSA